MALPQICKFKEFINCSYYKQNTKIHFNAAVPIKVCALLTKTFWGVILENVESLWYSDIVLGK